MADDSNALRGLLETLRASPERAGESLRASAARMQVEPEYRAAMLGAIGPILRTTRSTHLLTEAGLLSDEGIVGGVARRVGAFVAPAPVRGDVLDLRALGLLDRRDRAWLAAVSRRDAVVWVQELLEHSSWDEDRPELSSALVILAARVAGAGLDARLSERVPELEVWGSPFIDLARVVDRFADSYAKGADDLDEAHRLARQAVARCQEQVRRLRSETESVGTTLHLSSSSLRMLQQLQRMQRLLACASDDTRAEGLTILVLELCRDAVRRRRTLHFVRKKLDLLSYLAIGHAAQQGSKYAARQPSEYRAFVWKSLFGGFIVAIFASFKLHLSHEGLAPLPQALVYGANYAVCFMLIYALGATLATKQPALTASAMAASLEGGADSDAFPSLVRDIWRSQFVSFLGNMSAAAIFAAIFAWAFRQLVGAPIISEAEGLDLAEMLHPFDSGALFYAAVAGVLLSVAGFISGFVDNAVVFHRVRERVLAGNGIFRALPGKLREALATRIEKSTGAMTGNFILGFMLGSAGTFGFILGIPLDIRHIAFASSHATVALMHAPELVTAQGVAIAFVSVSLIGFVNFIVSFLLTLNVALNARRLEGVDWRASFRAAFRLARREPLSFFRPPRSERPAEGEVP